VDRHRQRKSAAHHFEFLRIVCHARR
jgi:hypothetical protein